MQEETPGSTTGCVWYLMNMYLYMYMYQYLLISQADRQRTPTEIRTRRTKVLSIQNIQEILRQPTESAKVRKRTEFGMNEGENPLLTLSVDSFSVSVAVYHMYMHSLHAWFVNMCI